MLNTPSCPNYKLHLTFLENSKKAKYVNYKLIYLIFSLKLVYFIYKLMYNLKIYQICHDLIAYFATLIFPKKSQLGLIFRTGGSTILLPLVLNIRPN